MRTTTIVAAVLCLVALATTGEVRSENTEARVQYPAAVDRQSVVHSLSSTVDGADAITIPQMLSYQGTLTDTAGRAVHDSSYSVTFRLYTAPSGGSAFWNETQDVQTSDGLFTVLLGAVTPVSGVPDGGALYLGMQVGASELVPRLRLVSAAYAYKADTAGFAFTGGDNAWKRHGNDSVVETVHKLGISRGDAGNSLFGSLMYTHVNLGVSSSTGTSGSDVGYATVGGGGNNTASGHSAVVSGGDHNTASGSNSTIGGGYANDVTGYAAVVGGGHANNATGYVAVIGGGADNAASASLASIGGGQANVASGHYSTVPGGRYDTIRSAGDYSFAAGRHAVALHSGCFVWGDGTGGRVATGGNNEWRVRTSGGIWFYTNTAHTTGAYMEPGQSGWTSGCDRANKEQFVPIDKHALLERLAQMPVTEYRFKGQDPAVRHIGPVAQDFYAAFGLGETDLGINSVDADGVALAAIQALYEDNKALRAEVEALKARLDTHR